MTLERTWLATKFHEAIPLDQTDLPLPPLGYRLATHAEAVRDWLNASLMWRLRVKGGSWRPTQVWMRFGFSSTPALYAVREQKTVCAQPASAGQ